MASNSYPPLHPFYVQLFTNKLDQLTQAQRGIGCIARVIQQMEIEKNHEDGAPDWWNNYVLGGLLDGIEVLTDSAHQSLELLQERVRQGSIEGDAP